MALHERTSVGTLVVDPNLPDYELLRNLARFLFSFVRSFAQIWKAYFGKVRTEKVYLFVRFPNDGLHVCCFDDSVDSSVDAVRARDPARVPDLWQDHRTTRLADYPLEFPVDRTDHKAAQLRQPTPVRSDCSSSGLGSVHWILPCDRMVLRYVLAIHDSVVLAVRKGPIDAEPSDLARLPEIRHND